MKECWRECTRCCERNRKVTVENGRLFSIHLPNGRHEISPLSSNEPQYRRPSISQSSLHGMCQNMGTAREQHCQFKPNLDLGSRGITHAGSIPVPPVINKKVVVVFSENHFYPLSQQGSILAPFRWTLKFHHVAVDN